MDKIEQFEFGISPECPKPDTSNEMQLCPGLEAYKDENGIHIVFDKKFLIEKLLETFDYFVKNPLSDEDSEEFRRYLVAVHFANSLSSPTTNK